MPSRVLSSESVRKLAASLATLLVAFAAATGVVAADKVDLIMLLDGSLSRANSQTDVPILLPEEVPATFARGRVKVTERAGPAKYDFELALTRNCRHSARCDIGTFSGTRGGRPGPSGGRPDLRNRVKLLGGYNGFFKLGSCATCALSEIQWKENGVVYDIRWKSAREVERETILGLANEAIRGGIRG